MNILNYANLNAHKERPFTPHGKHLTLWNTSDSFLHCCIESQGCRFSKESGACVMCDYGVGKGLTLLELNAALENVLAPRLSGIKTILFGSYGSVLDEYEISEECFDAILEFAARQYFENVIFETHYSTVTPKKLHKIKKFMGHRCKTTIEMGYESCDEYILSNCLNKIMNLEKLKKTITLIHNEGMEVCLNVFVGAPFISVQEQTLTAVKSIEWAFLNGADSVVIFPSNIKPFTLLYDLYKDEYYFPVSQWQLIDVLDSIPIKYLDRISLSWYGDRKNFYENDQFPLIPPSDCSKCHDIIFSFYQNFRNASSGSVRKKLLNNLLSVETGCLCRHEYMRKYNCTRERFSPEQIRGIVENVRKR